MQTDKQRQVHFSKICSDFDEQRRKKRGAQWLHKRNVVPYDFNPWGGSIIQIEPIIFGMLEIEHLMDYRTSFKMDPQTYSDPFNY